MNKIATKYEGDVIGWELRVMIRSPLVLPRVTRRLIDARQLCVEHMDINSPFFHEQLICGTRCQTCVFHKITVWKCLKKDVHLLFARWGYL